MRFSSPSQTLGQDEAQTDGQEEVKFDPPPSYLGGEGMGRTCITDSVTIQDPARFGKREGEEEWGCCLPQAVLGRAMLGAEGSSTHIERVGGERAVVGVASSRQA